MINAHDLREMVAFVKSEPQVIKSVEGELVAAATSGEDSAILNRVAAEYVKPLKLYLESREYDVVVSDLDIIDDSVDMVVSWKVKDETPPTEESPEDTLKKWPVEFSISSEELLAKFELGKNRQHATLPAITLTPTCLSDRLQSGWTVSGEVNGDAGYFWVNEFHAKHPKYGRVYGNLEKTVYYTSDEGLEDFINTYKVCIEFWDYGDI